MYRLACYPSIYQCHCLSAFRFLVISNHHHTLEALAISTGSTAIKCCNAPPSASFANNTLPQYHYSKILKTDLIYSSSSWLSVFENISHSPPKHHTVAPGSQHWRWAFARQPGTCVCMAGIGTGNQFGTVSHGDTQRVATPLKYHYSPTVPTCLSVPVLLSICEQTHGYAISI